MSPDIALTKTPHGRFFVPSNDFLGRIFMHGQHFEEHILSIILPLLDEIGNRNVVDVGANFGCHAVPYSYRTIETVYAFEPQTFIYELLVKNIAINDRRNIVPYQVALGHQDRLPTTLGDKYELHNRVQSLNEPYSIHNYGGIGLGKGGERVMMMTLDSYKLENVGLVKIDVEGAERLVLDGAAETIDNHRPYIVLEHHAGIRQRIFNDRWNDICRMYSIPSSAGRARVLDMLTTDYGYPEVCQLDESNYLAVP